MSRRLRSAIQRVTIIPSTREEAHAFVRSWHRHNKPATGFRFAIGASDGAKLVGVATVGRPTAREWQDGFTAEVTRVCTNKGAAPKGTNGALYAACWRAWRAMGGLRLITYTLTSESGASLRGAGATLIAERKPRNPAGWQNRHGREFQPVVGQAKFVWEWAA
jgi:hypothetical protein